MPIGTSRYAQRHNFWSLNFDDLLVDLLNHRFLHDSLYLLVHNRNWSLFNVLLHDGHWFLNYLFNVLYDGCLNNLFKMLGHHGSLNNFFHSLGNLLVMVAVNFLANYWRRNVVDFFTD